MLKLLENKGEKGMLPDCKEYDKMFDSGDKFHSNTCDECEEEWWMYPQPLKIVVNGITTICLWDDGEKTMVRRMEGEEENLEMAVAMCIVKRFVCSHSHVMRLVAEAKVQPEKKKKEKLL
jgi:hypothetical protein